MDKDYLLEEVIEGLSDLAPFSKTLIVQAVNEDSREQRKTLQEAELIVEHLASCIVALRKVL